MPHPDEEISSQFIKSMNEVAHFLERVFNGDKTGEERETCFVLLLAPFGDGMFEGRVNYISNGPRPNVTIMLREILARFEGHELKGSV